MKRKLAVLRIAIMAAATTTACSGKDAKTITATEVVTQADTTAGMTGKETENAGAVLDSEITTESQSSESASQEVVLLEEMEDISHTGAKLEQSEIKSLTEKMQKAVADKDIEALTGPCAYPVYVSLGEGQGGETTDELAFLKMDAGQIFIESLPEEIADTDIDTLEQSSAGVIMGEGNSVIFNNADKQTAIIGINLNQNMSKHTMSGYMVKKNKISH